MVVKWAIVIVIRFYSDYILSTYTLVDSRLNIGINNKVGLPHVLRQIDILYFMRTITQAQTLT